MNHHRAQVFPYYTTASAQNKKDVLGLIMLSILVIGLTIMGLVFLYVGSHGHPEGTFSAFLPFGGALILLMVLIKATWKFDWVLYRFSKSVHAHDLLRQGDELARRHHYLRGVESRVAYLMRKYTSVLRHRTLINAINTDWKQLIVDAADLHDRQHAVLRPMYEQSRHKDPWITEASASTSNS